MAEQGKHPRLWNKRETKRNLPNGLFALTVYGGFALGAEVSYEHDKAAHAAEVAALKEERDAALYCTEEMHKACAQYQAERDAAMAMCEKAQASSVEAIEQRDAAVAECDALTRDLSKALDTPPGAPTSNVCVTCSTRGVRRRAERRARDEGQDHWRDTAL